MRRTSEEAQKLKDKIIDLRENYDKSFEQIAEEAGVTKGYARLVYYSRNKVRKKADVTDNVPEEKREVKKAAKREEEDPEELYTWSQFLKKMEELTEFGHKVLEVQKKRAQQFFL